MTISREPGCEALLYDIDCTVQESKYDGVLGIEPYQVPAGVRGDQREVRRTAGQLLHCVPLHLPLGQRRGVRHRHETNGEQRRDFKRLLNINGINVIMANHLMLAVVPTYPMQGLYLLLFFTGYNSVVPLWRGSKSS